MRIYRSGRSYPRTFKINCLRLKVLLEEACLNFDLLYLFLSSLAGHRRIFDHPVRFDPFASMTLRPGRSHFTWFTGGTGIDLRLTGLTAGESMTGDPGSPTSRRWQKKTSVGLVWPLGSLV